MSVKFMYKGGSLPMTEQLLRVSDTEWLSNRGVWYSDDQIEEMLWMCKSVEVRELGRVAE